MQAFDEAGRGRLGVLSVDALLLTGALLFSQPRGSSVPVVDLPVQAGVYLAQGSQAFSATGPEVQQTITMRGRLGFGNLQSVNHVALQSGLLIVAAGLGGLKIVQVN